MKNRLLTLIILASSVMASESFFFPAQGAFETAQSVKKKKEVQPTLNQLLISLPRSAKSISKVTIEYKNEDGSFDEYVLGVNRSIDSTTPITLSQKSAKKKVDFRNSQEIAAIKNATFYAQDKTLKIVTKDKMIRYFLMEKPNRIILDFESKEKFTNYTKKISNGIFTKIKLGSYSDRYRMVVELNKEYTYRVKKISNGYSVTFK